MSGLAKVKATSFTNNFRNPIPNAGRDGALTAAQIGFKLEMSDQVESLIILNFEDHKTGSVLDEAFVDLNSGNWGIARVGYRPRHSRARTGTRARTFFSTDDDISF